MGLTPTFQVEAVGGCIPHLSLINTAHLDDNVPDSLMSFSCRPDCTVMNRDHIDLNPELESKLDSSLAEFFIEFKTKKHDDPFRLKPTADNTEADNTEGRLMHMAKGEASTVTGQITAYTTSILGTQYRTHTFLVLIVEKFARLIRWDRGGAVVTERIYYDTEPHLFEFLIRYNYADSSMRGHDVTVHDATADEAREARIVVKELQNVNRLVTVDIQGQHYVIGAPCARPEIPVGRWTRTSIAYGCQEKARVFLKDSWRVFHPGMIPEADIYTTLQQSSVRNVPRCLVGGDISDETYHGTKTHNFVQFSLNPASKKITHYRHHRLVLDTVGRNLYDFKCSKEMVHAIHASLIGKYIISYWQITVF
jgi:hypothetical protein